MARFVLPVAKRRPYPRGVYPAGEGFWRARVKHGGKLYSLGRHRSPTDAAAAVKSWYREMFGEGWLAAYTHRQATPWGVVRHPQHPGYQLRVWVQGIEQTIEPTDRNGFQTRAEARAYFRRWVRDTFGMFHTVALWRSDPDAN